MPAIELIKRPSETIDGETSKWNAVANPVTYKFQRKDIAFDALDNYALGDPIKLKITGVTIAAAVNAALNAGDPVTDGGTNPVFYVHFNDPSYLSGFYAGPTDAPAFDSGGDTFIDLVYVGGSDVPGTGASSGGYINSTGLGNFGIEIQLYDGDTEGVLTTETFIQTASPSGEILFNAAPVLKSFLLADNNMDLEDDDWAGTPYEIDEQSKHFYIHYRMVYDGSAESYTDDVSNKFFVILAGLNIPSAYGSNLAEYVTFQDGTPKAKWLTKLAKPVMWKGWPFSVEVIVGDLTPGFLFEVKKDGANAEATDPADINNKLVQLSMNGLADITDDTEELEVKGYRYATQVTEELLVEVRHACSNPVMLLGRNAKGGPLYWLFGFRQVYSYTTGEGKKVKEMVLVADNLSQEQFEALQDFIRTGAFYNDYIGEFTADTIKTKSQEGNQVYVLSQDGAKIGVTVVPAETTTNTRKVQNYFELTIQFPEEFIP